MNKSVIFDMDGTIFQTNEILEVSLEDTFDQLRKEKIWVGNTPIEKYREIMGVPLPVVWDTLLPKQEKNIKIMANDIFHEHLINNINSGKGKLYPDAKKVMQYLKMNNYSIYIASNGLKKYLNAITSFFKLESFITEVFSIEDTPSGNKGDMVAKIINKYDIKKATVVGDRLSDINAAKDNKLIAVGCEFDFAQIHEFREADFTIKSLKEIVHLVDKRKI